MNLNIYHMLVTLRAHFEPFLAFHEQACQAQPFIIDGKTWQAKKVTNSVTAEIDNIIRQVAQTEYFLACQQKIAQNEKNYVKSAIYLGDYDVNFIDSISQIPQKLLELFETANHAFLYLKTKNVLSDVGRDVSFDKLDPTGKLFLAKPKIMAFLRTMDETWGEQSAHFEELKQFANNLQKYVIDESCDVETLRSLKIFVVNDKNFESTMDNILKKCLDVEIDSFETMSIENNDLNSPHKVILYSDNADASSSVFEYRFMIDNQAPLTEFIEKHLNEASKAVYLTAGKPILLDDDFKCLMDFIPTHDFLPTMIFVSLSGLFDDTLMAGVGVVNVSRADIEKMMTNEQVAHLEVSLNSQTWKTLKQTMLEMSGTEHVSTQDVHQFNLDIYEPRNLLGRPMLAKNLYQPPTI